MTVQQLSVYLENKRGTLRELVSLLGGQGINILALSLADTTGFGIVRCVVSSHDIDKALNALRTNGFIAKTSPVLCIRIPNTPGSFSNVLSSLESFDISIEYAYSFCRSTLQDAVLIIRPSDTEKCISVLDKCAISAVSQEEVDSF